MLKDVSDRTFPGTDAWDAIGPLAPVRSHPMLSRIAELCVHAGADVCAMYLASNELTPVAFASNDLQRWGSIHALPFDEAFADIVARLGIVSVVTEPLVSEKRSMGMLVLGFARPEPTGALRATMAIVPAVIAMALEQAEELAHHYRVSKRLQKALLPARLARVESLEFDAAYRPASDEAEVGGDWYDVFEIGDGTIGISVGDVTGHGLEAAVAMSEIARAIRSAAASTESPSALLNYVDAFVTSHGVAMATAIVGIYDPKTRVLRYASAGHPHPVLVTPTNRALFLPGGGTLLGLGLGAASTDWTVTLTPGSTCHLYTDGLLEYGRDVISGENALLAALERLAASGDRSAEALHDEIFADVRNNDDVATLSMHNRDTFDARAIALVYSAIPASSPVVREALRHFLGAQSIGRESTEDILAAAGEAISNAIEHGDQDPGTTFELDVRASHEAISIRVESKGHWRAFTPRAERGRGITIMRACSDDVELASTRDHTSVSLTFARQEFG